MVASARLHAHGATGLTSSAGCTGAECKSATMNERSVARAGSKRGRPAISRSGGTCGHSRGTGCRTRGSAARHSNTIARHAIGGCNLNSTTHTSGAGPAAQAQHAARGRGPLPARDGSGATRSRRRASANVDIATGTATRLATGDSHVAALGAGTHPGRHTNASGSLVRRCACR